MHLLFAGSMKKVWPMAQGAQPLSSWRYTPALQVMHSLLVGPEQVAQAALQGKHSVAVW